MSDSADRADTTTVDRLIEQVERLVLPQANVFLRELLRDLGLKPQPNKAATSTELVRAIEDGTLTEDRLDSWLRGVEGWGNQHIYPYTIPATLARAGSWQKEAEIASVAEAAFAGAWRASTSSSYPDTPELTRIDHDVEQGLFVVEWHKRTESRVRAPAMDGWPAEMLPAYAHPPEANGGDPGAMPYAMLIDGDTYWFDAYRLQPARSVMRFAILHRPRMAAGPIAALFVRSAINNPAHTRAVERAWSDLARLEIGGIPLARVRNHPWSISMIIQRLDTGVVEDKAPGFASKKVRFTEESAEVEFTLTPTLTLPPLMTEIRQAVTQIAIGNVDFHGAEGDFRVAADPDRATSRPARLQLFRDLNRIRVWTELDRWDVWAMLESLDGYR